MNNGPYTDIDTQEYRPGPLTPKCRMCDLPEALCDCPPSWHTVPDDPYAVAGWWPTAVFAILALVMGAAFVHGWWPL